MKITEFHGKHRFLSNFWPARVILNGQVFPTVEHAYVAAKTTNMLKRAEIAAIPSPGEAKRFGRRMNVRQDWDQIKLGVMEDLIRQKFHKGELARLLFETGDVEIEEGNSWGDTYWGICRSKGENHLGKILMKIRAELKARDE